MVNHHRTAPLWNVVPLTLHSPPYPDSGPVSSSAAIRSVMRGHTQVTFQNIHARLPFSISTGQCPTVLGTEPGEDRVERGQRRDALAQLLRSLECLADLGRTCLDRQVLTSG
ncbi:hypothetical protein LshimejAT787_0407950 [Lyophyllum shimeji]|uniref:Uncharacterized protein n=1 Tax=Lyophyllum shimeji TaxID=47721 RepID=A0A9P3PLP3_LYOSH|nr:hypothetical protein LshimejAT787_0407950 [Lyophyllum shimeji]